MNVEIGTEAPIFLFWEYLFQIFGILSLQCSKLGNAFSAAMQPIGFFNILKLTCCLSRSSLHVQDCKTEVGLTFMLTSTYNFITTKQKHKYLSSSYYYVNNPYMDIIVFLLPRDANTSYFIFAPIKSTKMCSLRICMMLRCMRSRLHFFH